MPTATVNGVRLFYELLTKGDQSPPPFAPVIERLTTALPRAEVVTLRGAGHIPHATHPDVWVDTLVDFVRRSTAEA